MTESEHQELIRKKKRRKRRIRRLVIFSVLTILSLLCVGLIFFKVQGFKKTLVDLVAEESNGQYELIIDDTDIEYLELYFSLTGVSISKVDKSDSTGLLGVTIPQIEVNLGSFFDLLKRGQLKIEDFSIMEPLARVSTQKPETSKEPGKKEPVNLAHEIVSFYPGIKAILDHFDIENFRIYRADLQLNNSEKMLEVQLIDLLVQNWNMLNLSDDAQFKLMLEKQGIDFTNSSFSFDSISWSYSRHALEIDNYSFIQKDSLNRIMLSLEGASVVIKDMDYAKLMDEEYVFDLLQINQPIVTANIYPHETDPNKVKSRQPVSDILKKNLKELLIRNGEINQAQLHLNIMRPADTVRLFLPEMTLETTNFIVTEDSSTLMIEDLKLSLSGTELDLGNGLAIQFSEMNYDKNYNVDIQDIVLIDTNIDSELLTSKTLGLYNFNIFNFIYTNDLLADSLLISGGNLTVFESPGDIVQSSKEKKKPSGERSTVHLGKAIFDNIDINYNYGETSAAIGELLAVTDNLIIEGKLSYDLRYFKSSSVKFSNDEKDISASLKNVFFRPRRLDIESLEGSYREIDFNFKEFAATPENFSMDRPFYHFWNTLYIKEMALSGSLPKTDGQPKKESEKTQEGFHFERILFDKLTTDLELSQDSHLSFISENFELTDFSFAGNSTHFGSLTSRIYDIEHSNKGMVVNVDDIKIDNKNNSSITGISLTTPKGDSVGVHSLSIGPFVNSDSSWSIDLARLDKITFHQSENTITSNLDSMRLEDIEWNPSSLPHVKEIDIYNPLVQINAKNDSTSDSDTTSNPEKVKKKSFSPFTLFDILNITPGSIAIGQNEFDFGEIEILSEEDKVEIAVADLTFDTPSSTFSVGEIKNDGDKLHIYRIKIDAKPEFVQKMETENDVVSGSLDHLIFSQVQWDSLIRNNRFFAEQLILDGFNFTIRRDKTLPDPEPVTKPTLLSALIPQSESFSLKEIQASGGMVTYYEVGEKTGQEGHVSFADIEFQMNLREPLHLPENVLTGSARFYNSGKLDFNYSRLDSNNFNLEARLTNMVLDSLNQMVNPLEAVKFKSGFLKEFDLSVTGNDSIATGTTLMSYEDLHIQIFKKHTPDVKNFGSALLTALADGVILKHSKTDATHIFQQERITFKGPINYWVKCAIHGAITTIRKGKNAKNVSD